MTSSLKIYKTLFESLRSLSLCCSPTNVLHIDQLDTYCTPFPPEAVNDAQRGPRRVLGTEDAERKAVSACPPGGYYLAKELTILLSMVVSSSEEGHLTQPRGQQ